MSDDIARRDNGRLPLRRLHTRSLRRRLLRRFSAKVGYTRQHDPHAYLESSYARTMVPMEVIEIVPVNNAPLMERLMHHQLHPDVCTTDTR